MLTGTLVRLRPLDMSDLERYYQWINDREVTQFLAGPSRYPFSRAEEEQWLSGAVHRTHPPDVVLAIETSAEGRHIGSVGLHQISGEDRRATMGIMIGDKDFWSRGYGTDAILTLLRFAFDEMNVNRVALEVHADNARAIACYLKCGFVEEGRLRQDRYKKGKYIDSLIMGVLADEFRDRHPLTL
jgi:RimJ/RimL family protein N-acetyltransferase